MSIQAPTRSEVIAAANNAPELLAAAKAYDPSLFSMLTGSTDKYAWLPIVVAGVTWAAARLGLSWSADTDSEVAGLIAVVGMGIWHVLQPKLMASPAAAPPAITPAVVADAAGAAAGAKS